MFAGELGLLFTDFVEAEIVKPKFPGQLRLVVAGKLGPGFGHIGPLGESLAPPVVVFRNGMELRQIEGDRLHSAVDLGNGVLDNGERLHILLALESLQGRCGLRGGRDEGLRIGLGNALGSRRMPPVAIV